MIGNSQLVNVLISADQQQYRSAHKLIVSQGNSAVPGLIEALTRTVSERDHWRILLTLAEIGGQETVPTMIVFLRSPSNAIRALAAQFLGKVRDTRAVEPMIALILEADPNYTPMWVVQALGMLGDRQAVDPLLQFLARTESATERYMTIEALGLLGDPRAIENVKAYAFDQDHHVRDRAQIALRRLSGEIV